MLQPSHEILEMLSNVAPADTFEAKHIETTLSFVRHNTDSFWSRANQAGHLTASIFVLDHAAQSALLLHHAALDKWLQPGGHIDASDANIAAAALRELQEETGMGMRGVASPTLFDVDAHPIPARHKSGVHEPAHTHYDLRFLTRATGKDVALSDEAIGFRWISLAELAAREPHSGIGRMARKALNHEYSK
jgi:8-oxo-dGTP pyrophosphatase MutT (NUDIX family)